MSDEHRSASAYEMSDEQLDAVAGGIIVIGGSLLLPAVQRSPLLGGPDTKQPGDPCVPILSVR